jgi:DNA-damage-inducible protein J
VAGGASTPHPAQCARFPVGPFAVIAHSRISNGPGALGRGDPSYRLRVAGTAFSRYNVYMATTTMVHVRLDGKIKARAEKALSAMGLSLSDAVRVLLTRVAAEQALPFEVKVPNAVTRAAMAEARKGGLRSAASVSALLADVNEKD